jgi:signal transduction histidine kinase/integral membrane sensor domain MASE1
MESQPDARTNVRAPASLPLGVAGLLVVAAAYYLGAQLGFVLRFPPATTSVIWPPNALLTAALLLTNPRHWWLCIAAALPAHAIVEIQAGFTPAFLAALFVTNCLEALIAAAVVRRLSDDPTRFDTQQRVMAFVVGGVLLGPLVSSLPDAAAVHFFQGEPFGIVFVRRLVSNSLSQLLLVPSVVTLVGQGGAWLRGSPRRRRLEAIALSIALVVVSELVFSGYQRDSRVLLGGPYTALPLLMPLLMVAAVRFGPGGVSLSLLATALLAIGSAMWGFTPLRALPAEERVRALQIFLLVVGVPLLVMSALMLERRKIADRLRERLRFEELLSQLSGAFVHLPSHAMDLGFEAQLERVASFLRLDKVGLWQLTTDRQAFLPVAIWSGTDTDPPPSPSDSSAFGWCTARLLRQESVVCADPDELPATAVERELLKQAGVRSLLSLPLVAGGQVIGCLALVSTSAPRTWPGEVVRNCGLLADVFAGALARHLAEAEARKSREELAHYLRVSTIGELTSSIAHELNQPLAAILANAQVARRLLSGPASAEGWRELQDILADIIEADRRAGDVIRGLRGLLRKGENTREALDVNLLVEDVLRLLANDGLIRGVILRPELADEPLVVRGDRVQLQQVLLNLLVNALEALAGTAGPRQVGIRTERSPDGLAARVSVDDTGPGMAAKAASEAFQPFVTTKAKGMGMGLSIARSIVEAHGGRISFDAARKAGASFTFALPLAADHPSATPRP